MDFLPDTQLAAFRQQVREFLARELPPGLRQRRTGLRSPNTAMRAWQAMLHDKGWGAPYWAREHGGPGWSVPQMLAFDEECQAAGAPALDFFAHKLLGPVMNAFATPAQKAQHVPPILRGERHWCQGFSEPGSGSDLASLRTRAERDGDHYVVNGQKTWTTYGHEADWIFLLARTDAQVKKQAGISFLLVDMKSPGITVRPIRSIDDAHHLNETFFDNVRVPVGNLIGEEGGGWRITKFLLDNEHASAADLPSLKRYMAQLDELGETLEAAGGRLDARPEFALRRARLRAELQAVAMLVQRVAALEQAHDPSAHALGSILKIRGTELQQRMTECLVESLGDLGAVAYRPEAGAQDAQLPMHELASGLAAEMFFRRAATIYGGTSEVQRSIIAKSMFQL